MATNGTYPQVHVHIVRQEIVFFNCVGNVACSTPSTVLDFLISECPQPLGTKPGWLHRTPKKYLVYEAHAGFHISNIFMQS